MTEVLRLVDTGVAGAVWNVAVSGALLMLHAEGRIPDTLRLHRYHPCLLLGASQPDTAAPAGTERARRVTGGGPVAMTPGVLAWDLVTNRTATAESTCQTLVRALLRFGVAARYRPPGEIVAAGRKLAGIAGAFEGATRLHQGSLLVDCDLAELARLLGAPSLPLVTLADLVDPAPSMSEVADVIAAAFAAAIGLPLRHEPLAALELAAAQEVVAA